MHAIPAMAIQPSSSSASAIERAANLHFWLFIAYIGVLVLAAVLTWLVWHSGNKLQDAVRADSEANIAAARRDAALANAGLAKSNEEIARLNAESARSAERMAALSLKAEEERLARVRIEDRLNRNIRGGPPDWLAAEAKLRNFSGQKINLIAYPDDREIADRVQQSRPSGHCGRGPG